MSACANVRAGSSCKVQCKTPYVGKPTVATCPADNTDIHQLPDWEPPTCSLPNLTCEEPAQPPVGYEKGGDGKWGCSSAYAGKLQARCVPNADCVAQLELTGCSLMKRCITPTVDPCKVDLSDCQRGIWPGDSCLVHCKAPYEGNASTAACYADNTEADRELPVVEPACKLRCSDPKGDPEGYVRDGAGGWQCAPGYDGRASWGCAIGKDCVSYKEFSGCAPLQPCALPKVDNACKYDLSACVGLAPNSSCQVRCRRPYLGDAATAECPAGNTDASEPLAWTEQRCVMNCSDQVPLPIGYVSFPYWLSPSGWRCVDGYGGSISITCTPNADCTPELSMSGCKPIVPCAPPKLPPEEEGVCKYDALSCERVDSGEGCSVGCRAPYVGEAVRGECPVENTDPQQELLLAWPNCTLRCPDTEVVKEGYKRLASGDWACAAGYTGRAVFRCVIGTDCVARTELEGCSKLYRCVLPSVAAGEQCWIDWSDCADLAPGGTCMLSCKAPYVGNSTLAGCPAVNTDPLEELWWTEPECSITCRTPDDPPGYEASEWECAEGYAGAPSVRCTTLTGDCRAENVFSGCAREVPCAPPSIPAEHSCKLNASECVGVEPGGSCEVRCVAPYAGTPTAAFCPLGNANAANEVLWVEPACELECPDPRPIPEGYAYNDICGWHCREGYAGTASKQCHVGDDCSLTLQLAGCTKLAPCAPLQINDTCRLDASGCSGLQPGQECVVQCKAPFAPADQDPFRIRCPGDNTDPSRLPVWPKSTSEEDVPCDLDCPEPDVLPAGFARNASGAGFVCADGYVGEVQTRCTAVPDEALGNCSAQLTLLGCLPIVPCQLPATDFCQFDFSDCGANIDPGRACAVKCKMESSYMRSPGHPDGQVSCPEGNTDPANAVFQKPTCDLGCRPAEQQEGYVYHTLSESWMCARGWIGQTIREGCWMDESCIVYPLLTGCTKLQPCKVPAFTDQQQCVVNASDCASVQSGMRCTLQCQSQMIGFPSRAACPLNNVDPETLITWKMPSCDCRDHHPLPDGYTKSRSGLYSCASGYVGMPVRTCDTTKVCDVQNYRAELSGCRKLMPCAPLQFESNETACRFEVSNCSTLDPGESCEVGCPAPYVGSPSRVVCPSSNTDPWKQPENLPDCHLACRGLSVPEGYQRATGWRCAPGYRGRAHARCANTTACGSELQLSGCRKWVPCALPELATQLDRCRFDFSGCLGTAPGSFCEVRCRLPFRGRASRALCPPDNIDPARELVWVPPSCDAAWEVPPLAAEGYIEMPGCGWRCAAFHHGRAVVRGVVDDWCRPQLSFSGCAPTEPCQARERSVDACRIDASDCFVGEVPAGFACEVRCKAPYVGNSSTARCPEDNRQLRGDLEWSEPDCDFDCRYPDPLPAGYVRTGSSWECAPGHVGRPVVRCVSDSSCSRSDFVFSGCALSSPCAPPGADSPCMLNVSECYSVLPGSSCQLRCQQPYVGDGAVATCPEGNTDPTRSLEWQEVNCVLRCPDLDIVPKGYTKVNDAWQCSDEATGTSLATCTIDANCTARISLEGCSLLQPCLVPAVDACRINMTDCFGIQNGEMCRGFCNEPFVGPVFNGSCPEDNIDPMQGIVWPHWSTCECPDPAPIPPGYIKRANMWTCAQGYTGIAQHSCTVSEDCEPRVELTGCLQVVDCGPPDPSYLGNRSQCQKVPAGEWCLADCISTPCIGGGPLEFRCPMLNVDRAQPPLLMAGQCEVHCEVCEAGVFFDTDPRPGIVTGTLSFGPAQARGSTLLPDIKGYRVLFADECGTPLGVATDLIPRGPVDFQCCLPEAYMATIEEANVPVSTTHLVVSVVTMFEELPHGLRIHLQDLSKSTAAAVTSTARKPAPRREAAGAVPAFALAAALVGCRS